MEGLWADLVSYLRRRAYEQAVNTVTDSAALIARTVERSQDDVEAGGAYSEAARAIRERLGSERPLSNEEASALISLTGQVLQGAWNALTI